MSETPMMLKTGLAEMFKGGVIMDVTTADQAKIAEEAGAVAVMALERVPADIRAHGGIARMADPKKSAKSCRPSPFPSWPKSASAILPKRRFSRAWALTTSMRAKCSPMMRCIMWINLPLLSPLCVVRDLGEALRRIGEGAAMIRTKGEAGSGNVVEAVRHMRAVQSAMRRLTTLGRKNSWPKRKTSERPTSWSRWSPKLANCLSPTLPRVALPRQPMPRS